MAIPHRQSHGLRAVRSRYTPREIETRLVRYLTDGQGYAALVGDDQFELKRALGAALDRVPGIRVISASGRLGHIERLTTSIVGSRARRGRTPGRSKVEHLFEEIAQARSRGVSLVVVVEDADLAAVPSLEHLRMACEALATNTIKVRIVLLGGSFLAEMLSHPTLAALQNRVESQFSI
jgi:type II secretory pathway predicted ATPase ExeA